MKFKIKSTFINDDMNNIEFIISNIIDKTWFRPYIKVNKNKQENSIEVIIRDEDLPEEFDDYFTIHREFKYVMWKIEWDVSHKFGEKVSFAPISGDITGISIKLK